MTAQDTVERVQQSLQAARGVITARRATVERLANVRARWLSLPQQPLLRPRANMEFSTDQSLMQKSARGPAVKVLVLGQHVANVRLLPGHDGWAFDALESTARYKIAVPNKGLRWSHDRDAAAQITSFIEDCSKKLRGGSPELQVQLQLVRRLCGPKSASGEPELTNLRAVRPFDFPTEIATVVDRNGDPATGNVDILARTVAGPRQRGAQFVVMELKQPSVAPSAVPKAFEQAIGYAAGLSFAANGLDGKADASAFFRLLGPEPKKDAAPPDYTGLPLRTHAVVVLPETRRAAAEAALAKLALTRSPPLVLGEPMGVGVLLYGATKRGKQWTLDDTSFEWLGPWRPTHAR